MHAARVRRGVGTDSTIACCQQPETYVPAGVFRLPNSHSIAACAAPSWLVLNRYPALLALWHAHASNTVHNDYCLRLLLDG